MFSMVMWLANSHEVKLTEVIWLHAGELQGLLKHMSVHSGLFFIFAQRFQFSWQHAVQYHAAGFTLWYTEASLRARATVLRQMEE